VEPAIAIVEEQASRSADALAALAAAARASERRVPLAAWEPLLKLVSGTAVAMSTALWHAGDLAAAVLSSPEAGAAHDAASARRLLREAGACTSGAAGRLDGAAAAVRRATILAVRDGAGRDSTVEGEQLARRARAATRELSTLLDGIRFAAEARVPGTLTVLGGLTAATALLEVAARLADSAYEALASSAGESGKRSGPAAATAMATATGHLGHAAADRNKAAASTHRAGDLVMGARDRAEGLLPPAATAGQEGGTADAG
jgi:hypothetical protein